MLSALRLGLAAQRRTISCPSGASSTTGQPSPEGKTAGRSGSPSTTGGGAGGGGGGATGLAGGGTDGRERGPDAAGTPHGSLSLPPAVALSNTAVRFGVASEGVSWMSARTLLARPKDRDALLRSL